MNKSVILFFLLQVVLIHSVTAQNDHITLLKTKFESLVEKSMKEKSIPGFAVGVIEKGKLIYAKGFGVLKFGGDKPVTTKSLFHLASVTKTFTATAIMQLVEKKKINLDAKVTEYLPYFKMNDKRFNEITIRHLLTHTSGIPRLNDLNRDKPEYDDGALERYVRSISKLALDNAPGKKFSYSDTNFSILGDVIAKISGLSYESYVEENIFKPLGMKNSVLYYGKADQQLLTSPHFLGKSGVITSEFFPYNRPHAPSSTLISNIDDMMLYAETNLNRGQLNGKKILNVSSYDLLWKPLVTAGKDTQIGLAWFITQYNGYKIIEHDGRDDGYISSLILAPDDSIAIVTLRNYNAGRGNPDVDFKYDIMKIMFDKKN